MEVVSGGSDTNPNMEEWLDAWLREVLVEVSHLHTGHSPLHRRWGEHAAEHLGHRELEEFLKIQ